MDYHRLFDIIPYQQVKYQQKIALAVKAGNKWKTYSTTDCLDEMKKVSAGLIDLGLERGDKIAIITPIGTPLFNFVDLGAQQIGVVVVPVHATCTPSEIRFIFNDATVKCCFVSDSELYNKVNQVAADVPTLKNIFTFEDVEDAKHWSSVSTLLSVKHEAVLDTMRAAIHEDDLATIIYTSGTTGKPKGVQLSHKNIVSNVKATIALVPINCDKRALSFLPMSHVFERMVTYTYMAVGASIYYAQSVDKVIDNLQEIKPHFFTSVPRLLERIYENIQAAGKEKGGVSQKILEWAIQLGKRYKGHRGNGFAYRMKLKVADLLVFRKWRKALGGRVEGVIVGAAALQPDLGKLFSAAGVEIREGYGLTETAPVISFNRFEPGGVRFGTVGIPIPGIDVKIEQPNENGDGEILVKGPNVMMGYHNNEDLTKTIISEDGWFRTGDVGRFVHKRFLKITDRKKDIFKTSRGKYVAPQEVENALRASLYIEQVMIIGFNRPYVTALILPSFLNLKNWCDANNVHWTAPQFMVINPKVVEFMEEEVIAKINEKLPKEAQVRKSHLLFKEWNIENGELTPTLKLRRAYIEKKYKKEIEENYVS